MFVEKKSVDDFAKEVCPLLQSSFNKCQWICLLEKWIDEFGTELIYLLPPVLN